VIRKNPDLVRNFVKATLEVVKYIKENPSYAAELYTRRSNAPKELADKAVTLFDWTPSGRGSGQDLQAALGNVWQWNKESGAIPADVNVNIEDAVEVRFLP
jgi:ABC-type nitrate/sulfonate/bicarbonate transport system substrate-binding protein